jgi:hypothetical protein
VKHRIWVFQREEVSKGTKRNEKLAETAYRPLAVKSRVTIIGTFPTTSGPDAGIATDILIRPAIVDIVTGHDPVLDTVLRATKGWAATTSVQMMAVVA